MAEEQPGSSRRTRRRVDPACGVSQRMPSGSPCPGYAAHTVSSAPQTRFRGYLSTSLPPQLSTPKRSPGYGSADISGAALGGGAYTGGRYRPSSALAGSPTRYQQRVMFEPQLPTAGQVSPICPRAMDPGMAEGMANEIEEAAAQYEDEAGGENLDIQTYSVTPLQSQSSISSCDRSCELVTKLASLEREISKREREERKQLQKDLKKWQKERRNMLLSPNSDANQENDSFDPSMF